MVFRKYKILHHEACSLLIDERVIPYILKISSRRRSIAICIDEKARVTVSAPKHVARKEIDSFIKYKSRWILEKLVEMEAREEDEVRRTFQDGSSIMFL